MAKKQVVAKPSAIVAKRKRERKAPMPMQEKRRKFMSTTQMKHLRTNATERAPVYRDGDPTRRIVSVPCGLWQSEIRMTEAGNRQHTNWFAPHAPCSKDDAMLQMTFGYGGRLVDFVQSSMEQYFV